MARLRAQLQAAEAEAARMAAELQAAEAEGGRVAGAQKGHVTCRSHGCVLPDGPASAAGRPPSQRSNCCSSQAGLSSQQYQAVFVGAARQCHPPRTSTRGGMCPPLPHCFSAGLEAQLAEAQAAAAAAAQQAQRWEQRVEELERDREGAAAAVAGARRGAALQEGLRHKAELGEWMSPLKTFRSSTDNAALRSNAC